MIKDTHQSLLPRRKGNKLLRNLSRAIRARIFSYDRQYEGGEEKELDDFVTKEESVAEEEETQESLILKGSELFICLYQFIGQCYYVFCAFYFKGFTPFAA